MTDVFISYSRRDKTFVRRLFDELEKQGHDAWVDWEDIPLTADWWKEIQQGIDAAGTFVFIISPDSVISDVCRDEIDYAIANNKRFVPILHREIVEEDHKAKMHSAIGSHNWIFFDEDARFDEMVPRLVEAITTDLSHVREHTRLLVRAREWDENGRNKSYLMLGDEIREAEAWLGQAAGQEPAPTDLHFEYILQSRAAASQRQRTLLGGVSVALVVAVALMVLAFLLFQDANTQRERAEDAQGEAERQSDRAVAAAATAEFRSLELNSLRLAGRAEQAFREGDQPEALDLAISANQIIRPPALAQSVLSTVAYEAGFRRILSGGHEVWVNDIAINSGDGRLAISGADDWTPVLWDIGGGTPLRTLEGHQAAVESVALDATGDIALTGDRSGQVIAWDTASGDIISQVNAGQGEVGTVALSGDGSVAAAGNWAGSITLWETNTGEILAQYSPHSGAVKSLQFGPGGRWLASAGRDGRIIVWDIAQRAILNQFAAHDDWVNDIAISPGGRFLLSGSDDTTVRLWDSETSELLREFDGHVDSVNSVAFSPDGLLALSGACGDGMIVWEVESGEIVNQFAGNTETVNNVAFNPDGQTVLYSGCRSLISETSRDEGRITIWGVDTGAMLRRLTGHQGGINEVAFSPDDARALSAADDGLLVLWDTTSGQALRQWDDHNSPVTAAAFSTDGQRIVSGGANGSIIVRDLDAGQNYAVTNTLELSGHDGRINALAFNESRNELASAGNDHLVRIWDPETGSELRLIRPPSNWTTDLVISPDGNLLVSSHSDAQVHLFDTRTGGYLSSLSAHRGGVRGLAFSPDGTLLATAAEEGELFLWDVASREQVGVFNGHNGHVNDVAFDPAGEVLISAGSDGEVILWEVRTREELRTYDGNFGAVTSVALRSDGLRALSGSADSSLILWRIDSIDELLAWVEKQRRLEQQASGPASDWFQIYFTEPLNTDDRSQMVGSPVEESLVFALNNAQKSIEGAVFEIDSPAITQALADAHNRGLQVRMVVDDEHTLENEDSTINDLIDMGIPVVGDDRTALMLQNYFIIDNTYVWTGSGSPVLNTFYRNNNDAILIESPQLAAAYLQNFNAMFVDHEFFVGSDGEAAVELASIADAEFELYLVQAGSGDALRSRIIELVGGAESSIRLLVFSFTLDDLGQAMVEKVQAGVPVEGLFETRGSLNEFSELGRLHCNNAVIRTDGNPYILQHKIIIIDEEIVITSSLNFSSSSFGVNNGSALIIHNPAVAELYTAHWRQQFEQGEEIDPVEVDCSEYE